VIRYAIEYLRSLVKSERGQDLVEYALLTGGIGVLLILAVGGLTLAWEGWFGAIAGWVGDLAPAQGI
jgi:Flp pilus assembly pilin Flp